MLFRYIAGNSISTCLKRANILYTKGKIPVINFAVENTVDKKKVFRE